MSLIWSTSRSRTSFGSTGLLPNSVIILKSFSTDLNKGVSIMLSSFRNVSRPIFFAQMSANLLSASFKARLKSEQFSCPLNIASQYLPTIAFAKVRFIEKSYVRREEHPMNCMLCPLQRAISAGVCSTSPKQFILAPRFSKSLSASIWLLTAAIWWDLSPRSDIICRDEMMP